MVQIYLNISSVITIVISMGNKISVFHALSSETRIKMLRLLLKEKKHISALAREIGIAVPVASRHVKILEKADLIDKKIIGNVHLLSVKHEKIDHLMEPLVESVEVEIGQDDRLDVALQQLPFVRLQSHGKDEFIYSVDGKKGYFLYEVEGKNPDVPINAYKPDHDVTVLLNKLVSVKQKKIFVKIKKKKNAEKR